MFCEVSTFFAVIRRSPTSIVVLEIEKTRSVFDHVPCICQDILNLFLCTIRDLDWHTSFGIWHIVETELSILSACSDIENPNAAHPNFLHLLDIVVRDPHLPSPMCPESSFPELGKGYIFTSL
jgi:hypothetical protein